MAEQSGGVSPFNLLSDAIARLSDEQYDRPLRLFAVACCHRIWHLLGDESRRDVGVVERYARGQAVEAEVDAVADGNHDIAGYAAGGTGAEAAVQTAWIAAQALARTEAELLAELESLYRLLRELVGDAMMSPPAGQSKGEPSTAADEPRE